MFSGDTLQKGINFFLFSLADDADVTLITHSLTFTPGDLTDCIRFNIVDDNIVEHEETFTIRAGGAATKISISDNDGMFRMGWYS